MDSFWLIDEASLAGVPEAHSAVAAAQPSGAETDAPFLTQVERVLGGETEPDTAFFMDTWTVGVAAATENFMRRREERKSREQETPGRNTFPSFTPFFVATAEPAAYATWPLREAAAQQCSMAKRQRCDDEEEQEEDEYARNEAEVVDPVTLESACRVLGVTATSTREQVRAAYRKMAGRYHPDRLARCGAGEQKLASDRMASINEAYRLLCAESYWGWSSGSIR